MIEALVLIVATVVTHGLWRQGRVRHLRQLVERPQPELAEAVGAGRDEAAIAGATAVSFAWEWSRIDPNVLDAIDFAAAKDLDSVIERVHHLGSAIQGRESASLEGVLERLKGYVGEQVAHERLVALGHDVEMAQTSNQEGWDLIVDGEPISIKTVGDLGDIETTDGIRVLAAEDATGEEVVGSIERLDGLSMEESRDLLDGAVEAISEAPDALLESITGVAFVFAGYREIRRVRDGGKSVGAATEDAIVGATLRTAGGGAGGTLGATIGTVVLPGMGTLIGGVAGSFVGAMSTRPVIGYARGRRVRRTSKELRAALADYGSRSRRSVIRLCTKSRRRCGVLRPLETFSRCELVRRVGVCDGCSHPRLARSRPCGLSATPSPRHVRWKRTWRRSSPR